MPDHRVLPDERRTRNEMLERIDLLERRLLRLLERWQDEVDFSLPGSIYIVGSGRHYPRISTRLRDVLVSLEPPGTGATVVGIYRNGLLLDTVTMEAGMEQQRLALTATFNQDADYATVGVITAGDGAENLVVQLRFG